MLFQKIKIKEDFIRLDALLKYASFTQTGGHSKIVIQNGEVRVNGEICLQRGKKIHIGDTVEFENKGIEVVNED